MRRAVVLGLVALPIVAAAQQPDIPRFRGGVEVVQFTVTVLDKDRRPVTGLTAADFDVLVDGKPRPLAAFAAVTLPEETAVATSFAPPVAPDVHTNRLPPEGRLVVIVMDRSIPNGQPMQAAHAIATAVIDRLGPADLAGVVYTAQALQKYSHGLTADRARLRAAVGLTTVGALLEPPPPPSIAEVAAGRGAMPAPKAQQRIQLTSEERSGDCVCGVCVPDTLTELAKVLSGATVRHKSILFIGSDIAIASQDPASACGARIYPARERLSRALDAANVTFHALDPRGLESLADSAESGAPIGRLDQSSNLFRQSSLAVLPDYTGGRVVLNTNTPEAAIEPIFDESRADHVLAVARDPAVSKDEDRHRIKISVKRSDVTVRTRNVYFAADPAAGRAPAPSAAAAALNELLPRADFPLQMNLVPQFSPDGSPEVRVLLGVDSGVAGKLDVLIGAFDRRFKPVGTPLKQRLNVPAAAVAGSSAFQWSSVLKPPPGDYEVRAAVATEDGTRAASVIGYVDVPDAAKAGLAMSGIVVTMGGAPILRRVFAAGEVIECSVQTVRAKGEQGDVAVRFILEHDANGPVSDGRVARDDTTPAGVVDSYRFAIRLPAASGRYVLTIEANDGRRTVARDVPVTVR